MTHNHNYTERSKKQETNKTEHFDFENAKATTKIRRFKTVEHSNRSCFPYSTCGESTPLSYILQLACSSVVDSRADSEPQELLEIALGHPHLLAHIHTNTQEPDVKMHTHVGTSTNKQTNKQETLTAQTHSYTQCSNYSPPHTHTYTLTHTHAQHSLSVFLYVSVSVCLSVFVCWSVTHSRMHINSNTAQHHTTRRDTRHDTTQCNAAPQHDTPVRNTTQHSTAHKTQGSTAQHNTTRELS